MNWLWFFFRFHLLCAICSHTHILHIFYCIATDFIFRQFDWRKTVCLNEPVMYTYKHKQWALNMNEWHFFSLSNNRIIHLIHNIYDSTSRESTWNTLVTVFRCSARTPFGVSNILWANGLGLSHSKFSLSLFHGETKIQKPP